MENPLVGTWMNSGDIFFDRPRQAFFEALDTMTAIDTMLRTSAVQLNASNLWGNELFSPPEFWIKTKGHLFLKLLQALHTVEPPWTWKLIESMDLSHPTTLEQRRA